MQLALVTGSGGFVGRHLCAHLRARGESVVALARRASRASPAGVRRVECDLDVPSLSALFARERPSVIYHAAGTTDMTDLTALYEANVCYAARLLQAAEASAPDATVLLVGSAAEYGPPQRPNGVVNEQDPCHPVSAYGISKLSQTHHGLAAAARGMKVVIARLFNPIGPFAPPTSALAAFARQLGAAPARGGVLTTGPLHAIRDFTHIGETARALVDLSGCRRAHGLAVNVCSGHGRSLSEMVERLLALSPVAVRHEVDLRRGGTSQLDAVVGDPTQLRQLELALPSFDVDAVLRQMLAEHAAAPAASL